MRPYKHPPPDQFALERIFHALSDPARLAIVRHLANVGMATCGELDGGRPKSSMSHHFRILREAGLIQTRPEGSIHQNTLRRVELDARFPGLLTAILAQAVHQGEDDQGRRGKQGDPQGQGDKAVRTAGKGPRLAATAGGGSGGKVPSRAGGQPRPRPGSTGTHEDR